MARVPYLDLNDLPPEHQELLARRANIYRALAHNPNGLRACRRFDADHCFLQWGGPHFEQLAD
jgi:hypothetical protein